MIDISLCSTAYAANPGRPDQWLVCVADLLPPPDPFVYDPSGGTSCSFEALRGQSVVFSSPFLEAYEVSYFSFYAEVAGVWPSDSMVVPRLRLLVQAPLCEVSRFPLFEIAISSITLICLNPWFDRDRLSAVLEDFFLYNKRHPMPSYGASVCSPPPFPCALPFFAASSSTLRAIRIGR